MPGLNPIDVIAIGVCVITASILLRPAFSNAPLWHATVTPLASIIGSGFLVVAPMLNVALGGMALVGMIFIVLVAFLIGGVIRYNIGHSHRDLVSASITGAVQLERGSDLALALAYVVSVAFYIRLLAAFLLSAVQIDSELIADFVATVVLLFIGGYGSRYGLHGLERLETYSVTIKLAIIAALLVWLAAFDMTRPVEFAGNQDHGNDLWETLRVMAGLLLVVQGFETSRYLGAEYSSAVRIRTMRWAQLISAAIYVTFIALVTPLIQSLPSTAISETSLIDAVGVITPLLPVFLIVAALMSQFSAAIADTLGAGGVVEEESKGVITTVVSYPVIACGAVLLIWVTNIFELVALASRAFALFYLLQTLLAIRLVAFQEQRFRRVAYLVVYSMLALLMLFVVIYAKPAEI